MSRDLDGLIEAAARAHGVGRLDEAQRLAEEVLRARPKDVRAIVISGIVAAKRNDPKTALPLLESALTLDPACSDASFWLSMIFRSLGRAREALEMAERAAAGDPGNAFVQNLVGMCLMDHGRAEDAIECFQRACDASPGVGPLFDNLGRANQACGKLPEAVAAFERSLTIGPVQAGTLLRLGDAYLELSNLEGAARCGSAALQQSPESAPANLLLARALMLSGRVQEGERYARRARELSPDKAAPVAYHGWALQSLGRIEEANAAFEKSIQIEPRQGFAYYSLIQNKRVSEQDRQMVDRMLDLSRDRSLPTTEILHLEFALGKAFEGMGDYGAAMAHFDEGNRIDHQLKSNVAPFQPEELQATVDFLSTTFDPPFLVANREIGTKDELPIFVVGMMRSGTTLVEQILSSHPDVGGAGEERFWPANAGYGRALFRPGPSGPELDSERLRALAIEYLDLLRSISPGKARVVDKMNTNYLLLGLLHLAYPNARFIHMKRHPVDTCLSIWATPPAERVNMGASKENVVFAYEQYLRLMDHWRQVLPADRLLDVQYEDLVADQEAVTRKMIRFCGLEWSDLCLAPEKNQRVVTTPSVWQVRQPVYKTSVERWRRYEPYLGAFAQLLGEKTVGAANFG